MPREKEELNTESYSARVAARLAACRQSECGNVEELQRRLAEQGHQVPASTLYAYERGRANGGRDVPLDLIPALSAAFGYQRATSWLPSR